MQGELCLETMQWLNRSLVGDLFKPTRCKDLLEKVSSEWIGDESLRCISSYSVLISFESKEVRDVALEKGEGLLGSVFARFRPWNKDEWSFPKLVWLECRGLPLQASAVANF